MVDAFEEVTPHFRDKREQSLFQLARGGMAAEQFLNSEVGRLVLTKMHEEVDEAMVALLDEEDADKASKLREQAKIASKAVEWLLAAMREGENAFQQLQVDQDIEED